MAISLIGSNTNIADDPATADWTLPGSWAANDVAIFWFYARNSGKNITPPGTVTTKHEVQTSGFGKMFVGYRTLQSGDSTFGWTATQSAGAIPTFWGTIVFRGVVTSGDPFEAQSGAPATFTDVNDPDPASVTTLTDGAAVLAFFGKQEEYTTTSPPSGYTSVGDVTSGIGSNASAGLAYKIKSPAGAENPGAWTLGGGTATDDGYIWTGAIKPAQTGTNQKSFTANLTFVAAFVSRKFKTLFAGEITIAPTGSLRRKTKKPRTGALTFSGNIATRLLGPKFLFVTAALATSGSLVRKTKHPLAATVAFSGALSRKARRNPASNAQLVFAASLTTIHQSISLGSPALKMTHTHTE